MRSTVWIVDPAKGRARADAIVGELAAKKLDAAVEDAPAGPAVVIDDAPDGLAPPADVVRSARIAPSDGDDARPRPLFLDLGRLGIFVFWALVVTGALLALSYRPSTDGAHAGLVDAAESGGGWFVRSLHRVAGQFLAAIVVAYVLRGFFRRLFLGPRGPAAWRISVGFGFVVLAFLLTGFALPWNDVAYRQTVAAADSFEKIPLVGDALAHFLRGGSKVSTLTLVRLYAIHALLLPWAAFWLFMKSRDLRRAGGRP